MFDKKVKISTDEFKIMVKDIELEAKKEQEQKMQELKIKYFTLKENYEELQKAYIKVVQENDILKAQLQELLKHKEEETLNTLSKYEDLDKLLDAAVGDEE
ncbi:hypothetical protein N4T77_02575 [Clostridium sp. CX1]|uniref:hypothetical protein n=1 Tax=Clostridium sp. CX1 TaxID=2978346 RepID=UPI0021BEF943|nr:hypothetical protein [Clostridium sp. CX1]MCT8975475.1 hypothetical protein [Clostridium sp. CX1]